jgi:hypothetical protein
MATSSTLRIVRTEIDLVREPEARPAVPSSAEMSESRLRRFFRRKARRRALVSGWREEATLRSMIMV